MLRESRVFAWMAAGAAGWLLMTAAAQAETVRVTAARYSEATKPYFDKVAADFMKANPGIDIKIEEAPWDGLQQKLMSEIALGANPDISIVGTRWLPDFLSADAIEPLDPLMNAAFKDRFIGSYLSASTLKGNVYGLPIAASARALYYNKDLLAKAGFPDGPKTWDDLRKAAEGVAATGAWGFGLQGKESETDVYWYYALWTHGGRILDDKGKPDFASPAGIEALKLYKSLIDAKLTQPDVANYSREGVQDLFKAGKVAMVISAPFLRNQIAKEAPGLKYGIVPVPVKTTPATYGVTDSIVLFKNSKAKPAAWKFLDYLFQAEPRIAFTKAEGFLPVTKPEAEAEFIKNDPEIQTFASLLPTARFLPPVEGWQTVAESLWTHLQRTYAGKADPEKSLKTAAGEAERAMP